MQDIILRAVADHVGGMRVTRPIPDGRAVSVAAGERSAKAKRRDDSSSWSAFIRYVDAAGQESGRRVTCRKITGFGAATHISAFCHERQAARTFLVGSIVDLVCCETGEILDPASHFDQLRRTGALPVEDKVLTDVVRVLAFFARCDGTYHPLERTALEELIERYCVRFDGTDAMARDAVAGCGRIAPDAEDFVRSLNRVAKLPRTANVARFLLDCGAAIIDADGRHAPEETRWAVEASTYLKALC